MTIRYLPLACLTAMLGVPTGLSAAMAPVICRSDHGTVAKTICASPEYAAMDREIAALTDRAMAKFTAADRRRLAQSELHYFHKRQGCGWASHNSAHPGAAVDECVRGSLEDRVRAMRVLVERGGF